MPHYSLQRITFYEMNRKLAYDRQKKTLLLPTKRGNGSPLPKVPELWPQNPATSSQRIQK